MTEAELEEVLAGGVKRTRLNAALSWACAALLAGLLAGAALVLVARLYVPWAEAVFQGYWVLLGAVVGAGICGFARSHPSPVGVALGMDRSAGLDEHLTTWADLRLGPPSPEPLAQAFVRAQAAATLRRAEGLRPSRHLPLRLPAWSRGVWLGLLALGCALLMPEQPRRTGGGFEEHREASAAGAVLPAGGVTRLLGRGPSASMFRVELLTPTEFFKYQLLASSVELPRELKVRALEELEGKLGALPPADLDPEVRELLAALRSQVGREKQGEKGTAGALSVSGGEPNPAAHGEGSRRPGEAIPPSPVELVAAVRARFPDVAAALERYYMGEGGR